MKSELQGLLGFETIFPTCLLCHSTTHINIWYVLMLVLTTHVHHIVHYHHVATANYTHVESATASGNSCTRELHQPNSRCFGRGSTKLQPPLDLVTVSQE